MWTAWLLLMLNGLFFTLRLAGNTGSFPRALTREEEQDCLNRMAEGDEEEGARLSDYTLPETAMEYLDKMRRLCEEHGTELILVKAPTNSWAYWWYDEWEEQIEDYAEKHSLAYYNFIEVANEIGIDFSTDTYDGGVHLNVFGAEKLSVYFGGILNGSHGVPDRRDDKEQSARWEARVDAYEQQKQRMIKGEN